MKHYLYLFEKFICTYLTEAKLTNDILELRRLWKEQEMPWLGDLDQVQFLRPLKPRPDYRVMWLLSFTPHNLGDTIFQIYQPDGKRSLSHETSLQDMLREGISIFSEPVNFKTTEIKESHIKIIPTAEHQRWLFKTLQDRTCKQIVILSGWISSSVVNEHLKHLIERAIQRGVKILIGYGYDEKEKLPRNQQLEEEKALDIFKELHRNYDRNFCQIYRFRQRGQHAKILICDERYMIVSSFNWLSFSGKPDIYGRERIEYGVVIEDKGAIQNMIDELQYLFDKEGYNPIEG